MKCTLHSFCVAALSIAFFSLSNAEEIKKSGKDDKLKSQIADIWKAQKTSLHSIIVKCRQFHRKIPDGHDLNRDDVRMLLATADLKDNEALKDFAVALNPDLKALDPPWQEMQVWLDGSKSLVKRTAADSDIEVTDSFGLYDVRKRIIGPGGRQQISILPQGKLIPRPIHLEDLRVLPSSKVLNVHELVLAISNQDEKQVVLTKPRSEIKVNPKTGFVTEINSGTYGKGPYIETLQSTPMTFENGVILPKIYFQGRYRGDRLRSFLLRIIDEAIPNADISEDICLIAASPLDTVVDQTTDTPRVFTPPYNTIDVLELMLPRPADVR